LETLNGPENNNFTGSVKANSDLWKIIRDNRKITDYRDAQRSSRNFIYLTINEFVAVMGEVYVSYFNSDWKLTTHQVTNDNGKENYFYFVVPPSKELKDLYLSFDFIPDLM